MVKPQLFAKKIEKKMNCGKGRRWLLHIAFDKNVSSSSFTIMQHPPDAK